MSWEFYAVNFQAHVVVFCLAEEINLPYRRARDYAVAGLGISSASHLTLSWKQIFVLKLCINTDLNSPLYKILPHCIICCSTTLYHISKVEALISHNHWKQGNHCRHRNIWIRLCILILKYCCQLNDAINMYVASVTGFIIYGNETLIFLKDDSKIGSRSEIQNKHCTY